MQQTETSKPSRRGHGRKFSEAEDAAILAALQTGRPLAEVAAEQGRDRQTVENRVDRMWLIPRPKPVKVRQCLGIKPGADGLRGRCTEQVRSEGGVLWMCYDCRTRA